MGDAGYVDEKGHHHYYNHASDDKVVRDVTLTSFHIQKYEITLKELDLYTSAKNLNLITKKIGATENIMPQIIQSMV